MYFVTHANCNAYPNKSTNQRNINEGRFLKEYKIGSMTAHGIFMDPMEWHK
jgi:hypothetical protein